MVLYVQLEEVTNNVIGYSSNKVNNTDIEIVETEVEERFLNTPIFFRYNEEIEKFEFSEELKNKYIKERQNTLSDSEKIENLTKQLAESKVESMKKNIAINNLIKQRAEDKIDYMKSRNIIDMLTKQQAVTKLEIMKMKGEN